MTEKRFEYIMCDVFTDKESDEEYISPHKVAKILNEQHEKIKFLQKSLKRQQSSNEESAKYIEEIHKENEQLKSKLESHMCGARLMNERFKLKYNEYDAYYIDTEQEYVDEDFKLDGYKTMSDKQIADVLNKQALLIEELEKENTLMKGRIINSIQKSRKIPCNCNPCVCEECVIEELLR